MFALRIFESFHIYATESKSVQMFFDSNVYFVKYIFLYIFVIFTTAISQILSVVPLLLVMLLSMMMMFSFPIRHLAHTAIVFISLPCIAALSVRNLNI